MNRFRRLLKRMGPDPLTYVAKETGIPRDTLDAYAKGKRAPSPANRDLIRNLAVFGSKATGDRKAAKISLERTIVDKTGTGHRFTVQTVPELDDGHNYPAGWIGGSMRGYIPHVDFYDENLDSDDDYENLPAWPDFVLAGGTAPGARIFPRRISVDGYEAHAKWYYRTIDFDKCSPLVCGEFVVVRYCGYERGGYEVPCEWCDRYTAHGGCPICGDRKTRWALGDLQKSKYFGLVFLAQQIGYYPRLPKAERRLRIVPAWGPSMMGTNPSTGGVDDIFRCSLADVEPFPPGPNFRSGNIRST